MVLCGLLFSRKVSSHAHHFSEIKVSRKKKSNNIQQVDENQSKDEKVLSILDREPIQKQLMTLVMIQFENVHEIPKDFVDYVTSKIIEKIKKIGQEDGGNVSIIGIPQLHCQIMYQKENRQMNNIIRNVLKIKEEIEAISFLSERQGEGVPRIDFKISISTGMNMCGNIGIPNIESSIFGATSVRGIKLLELGKIMKMSLLCDFNSIFALIEESKAYLDDFLYTVVNRFEFSKGDVQCAFQILSESTVSQLDQWRYGSNEERNQYLNFLSSINLYFYERISEFSIDQEEYGNLSTILTKDKKSSFETLSLRELEEYKLSGESLPWKLKLLEYFQHTKKAFHIHPSLLTRSTEGYD